MHKLFAPFVTTVSVLFGSVVAGTAHAAIIVDNSNPSGCSFIEDELPRKFCNKFTLARVRDDSIGIEGYRFIFSFDDMQITYIAFINNNVRTADINGKTFTFYPVFLKEIARPGLEPESSGEQSGICGFAEDFSGAICQIQDSAYVYTGDPIAPGQAALSDNRAASQPASTSNQYTFNTNSHINTGVSVNPGDVVTIQASGTIRFGFFAGSGGPLGILFNPDYNYFFNLLHGQLMGRVKRFGAGEFDGWFPVGEGTEITVQNQGVLEFAVNDNQPGDNAGSFQIDVTIKSRQN